MIDIASGVKDILNLAGRNVTLRKADATTRNLTTLKRSDTTLDYTVKAHIKDAKTAPISGAVAQDMRECRIAAKDLGAVQPEVNDYIIDGSEQFKIESVNRHNHAGVDVLFVLKIRGNRGTI